MHAPFNHSGRREARGFSLVELILTIGLLILLFGAMAFNFSSLQRGTNLNEGATRFATMLRFARAHAAYTGHTVRLRLEDPVEGEAAESSEPERSFVLEWEAEPLTKPDRFAALPASSWDLEQLNELVAVARLEVPRPLMNRTMTAAAVSRGVTLMESVRSTELEAEPVLTFYPDGASDTARVVLKSRDLEDTRRVALDLEGLTGTIEITPIDSESEDTSADSAPAPDVRAEDLPSDFLTQP